MPNTLKEIDWTRLIGTIKAGNCTPFLGAGACYGSIPLGGQVAAEWAKEFDYPLEDSNNLIRVAQFLAVESKDEMFPKDKILERFKKVVPPDFKQPGEPHGVLADLPLPVYITTNYDSFMIQALKSRNKDPKRELCKWNKALENHPTVLGKGSTFIPTPSTPIVFHLHGNDEERQSLVLTEDDYLDFLMNMCRDQELLPARIQRVIAQSSLLFTGYSIADWNFRVLFRSLVSYLEKSLSRAHISVQIAPGGSTTTPEQKANAQAYLDKYYGGQKISVYWGTAQEFVAELKKRWEASSGD